jgi:outer membrane lipoprotein SlyB
MVDTTAYLFRRSVVGKLTGGVLGASRAGALRGCNQDRSLARLHPFVAGGEVATVIEQLMLKSADVVEDKTGRGR